MFKEKYDRAELEIIRFTTEDAVLSSPPEYEEDETPLAFNGQ